MPLGIQFTATVCDALKFNINYMSALLSRDGSREGHRGQCSSFLNHIWEANTMHWYVIAQFKLDICMHMLEEFLEKFMRYS